MPQLSLKPAREGVRFQPATTRGLRLANVRNETFDTKTRTFTFVLASETPVRTWRIDQDWNYVEVDEVLPMKGLRGLDGFRGCPLLDTHSSWSVRDVLGRITALRVEGSELVGDAFLSDRDDVAGVARDLETGVLGEFSVGFTNTKTESRGSAVTVKMKAGASVDYAEIAMRDTGNSGRLPLVEDASKPGPEMTLVDRLFQGFN